MTQRAIITRDVCKTFIPSPFESKFCESFEGCVESKPDNKKRYSLRILKWPRPRVRDQNTLA